MTLSRVEAGAKAKEPKVKDGAGTRSLVVVGNCVLTSRPWLRILLNRTADSAISQVVYPNFSTSFRTFDTLNCGRLGADFNKWEMCGVLHSGGGEQMSGCGNHGDANSNISGVTPGRCGREIAGTPLTLADPICGLTR